MNKDKLMNRGNRGEENFKKSHLKTKDESFFSKEFFQNSLVHWILIASIFVNIANWSLLAIFIRPTEVDIILHYNVYFGVDIVGIWWQTYLLPTVGVIFMLINAILAYFLFGQKERIAAHLLLLASFIVQAGILIAIISIIQINY